VAFLGRNALGASCIIRWNFWQVEQNGAWKKNPWISPFETHGVRGSHV
jgi:hypothetical protein